MTILILLLSLMASPAQKARDTAATWLSRAQTHASANNRAAALDDLRHAETLGAKDPMILEAVAGFYLALGDPAKASAVGTRALTPTSSGPLHLILGRAYTEQKQWPRAVAELKTAVQMLPYEEDAHFRLAQAYLLQQDFASAIGVLQNARKIFDKSAQIELALGVAYYGARKFPEAVDQFLKTMQLAPDLPQPYVFVGRMMEHAANRLPELTGRFKEFETRNPNVYLGYLLHAKAIIAALPPSGGESQVDTAVHLLEKAIAIDDRVAESHLQLGVLLDRKRDWTGAAAQYERTIALSGNDPAAHFRLAKVYDRLGRKEDAERERALHEKLAESLKR